MKRELILAVRRRDLDDYCWLSHGFRAMSFPETFDDLEHLGLWLAPRYQLEQDERWLQLIPYVVLTNGEGVLCYRRSPSGSESRLHGQLSLGIGGHVEISDLCWLWHTDGCKIGLPNTLEDASRRELSEEVGHIEATSSEWLGLICDNENAVGRVHLGILRLMHVDGPMVTNPEHAIAEPHVRSWQELEASADEFETWSKMVIPAIVEKTKPREVLGSAG